jgi:hypothetical protein
MEQSRMIVVIGGKNILRKSIEDILAAKPDWKVVSLTSLAELDWESENAEYSHQELVFILEGCHDDHLALKLFQEYPTCKVIQISLEDNLMDVYSIQKILFNQPADLLKVIEYWAPTSFLL